MDRKKIAVFATGWGPEITKKYIEGLQDGFSKETLDIYLFLNYAHTTAQKDFVTGELNIYNLPDLKDFSGAVVIGNGLDFNGLFEQLVDRCLDAGIPTVCTGRQYGENAYYVGSDNRIGATKMYEHIINEHNCHNIAYIAGHKDNPDSNIRLEVLRECLARNGYSLPEENIKYTNWSLSIAADYINEWCKSGRKLPDAFVCANDILTIPVCDAMEILGYRVPDDVVVTGFDNDFASKVSNPAITSVDQRFDKVGIECAHIISDLMRGVERDKVTLIASEFVPSESCGCIPRFSANDYRKKACVSFSHSNIQQSVFSTQLAIMESRLLEGTSIEDFGKNYAGYLEEYRQNFEGNTFYVMLEPSYQQSIYDSNAAFKTDNYSDKMQVAVAMDGDKIICDGQMDRHKLIPFVDENNKNNRFFIFLPLHNREMNYGYVVLGDAIEKLRDYNYINTYATRLSIILQLNKQRLSMNYMNEKLVEYSSTDPLTKVKNRTAYRERADKLSEIIENVSDFRFGLVMFDVNNLKMVNDEYGHEAGDQYIMGACQLIQTIFCKGPIYRIGGDEFVTVLKGEALNTYEDDLKRLSTEIEQLNNKNLKVYEKFSVAAGAAVYDPSIDKSVQDVFNRADSAMYLHKAQMKK